MEANGQGESRLDRLERLMVQYSFDNHEAHEEFRREHRVLLTAQMVLTEKLDKPADLHAKLDLAMLETTEKLNVLIKTVGGIIGRNNVN